MELHIYGDLLFATNFLMDLVILFLTVQMSRIELNLGRLTVAAGVLALYGTVSFLPELSFFVSFLCRSAVGALAIWILAPKSGFFGFVKARMVLSLVSVGMGGIVYALAVGTELGRSLRGISVNGTVYFLLDMRLLLGGIILSYLLLIWFQKSCIRNFSRDKILVPFTLTIGEEEITMTGLLDTGCELTAPGTGEGVLLISKRVLGNITPKESFWLPIHTASGDDRIPAFYPDDIVCLSQRYRLAEKPLVGIIDGRVSRDDLYSGVLNPKILDEKNRSGGSNHEKEATTVLTTLAKNLTRLAKKPRKRRILYRWERKPSGTPWQGGGRKSSCQIGYTKRSGRSSENPDREKFAVGCVHSPEV